MAFDTGAVANYVLSLGERDGVPLSPMKLQKLLYYAHGWHLALTGEPLLDEPVEAWKWGPVIPSVYHQFKKFGPAPIVGERFERAIPTGQGTIQFVVPNLSNCTGDVNRASSIIERVWKVFKPYSAVALSNMTHQTGTPWAATWSSMSPAKQRSIDIPDKDIEAHFKGLMQAKP